MTGETTAVLPLHRGTILLPGQNNLNKPNLVTKNANDGELIQILSVSEGYGINRRYESDVTTWTDGGYEHWPTAIACLADRQAFGYRQNGRPATMNNVADRPETVEIEPLNTGAILLQEPDHLPFGIYLDTAETYRLRMDRAVEDDLYSEGEKVGILEYREDNHSDFERLEQVGALEIRHLALELANHAPVQATNSPDRENLESIIVEHYDETETLSHGGDDPEIMEKAAIQDVTAIPPNFPAPAPLFPGMANSS